jgi:hypothetical protein
MRENCTYGSEGGAGREARPYPYTRSRVPLGPGGSAEGTL